MFALVLDNLLVPLRRTGGSCKTSVFQKYQKYSGVMLLNDILDLNRIYSHVFDLILHLDAASRAVA